MHSKNHSVIDTSLFSQPHSLQSRQPNFYLGKFMSRLPIHLSVRLQIGTSNKTVVIRHIKRMLSGYLARIFWSIYLLCPPISSSHICCLFFRRLALSPTSLLPGR